MQLYSEIYSSYYNIIQNLLSHKMPLSKREIENEIAKEGFLETTLYLMPKLIQGEWPFLKKEGEMYLSSLEHIPPKALTLLQKRWLKAVFMDPRIQLFFTEPQCERLLDVLGDVDPLFLPEDFYIFDRFLHGDDYADERYQKHFRQILSAIREKQYLNIEFQSRKAKRIHHWYMPCKLEYSLKNDCFRLLAIEKGVKAQEVFYTINLSRITDCLETGKYFDEVPDIDAFISQEYLEEPVTLLIINERNALERAMLHFANYKKNTTRIDENTYQCEIYYSKLNEKELLIEVLSFGPAIKVTGNEHFLKLLKEKLMSQKALALTEQPG